MIKKFVSTTLGITGLAVLIGASGIMCAMNTAQAQYVGPNQTQTYTTVSQILKNPVDDQYFHLKGKITGKQGHERYTFTDKTGSIVVEIDNKVFAGRQVGPDTQVEIWGKVDKDMFKEPKIDVKRLGIPNQTK